LGQDLSDRVALAYSELAIHRACEEILTLVDAVNKYLDERAPWTLFKQGKQTEVERVIYSVLESIRLAGYLLAPVIPNLSNKIYQQLGFADDFNADSLPAFVTHAGWGLLPAGRTLEKAEPIFARLELSIDDSL
ncbi:MAG: methionine--tRNA ligase, partial [Cyanobacteria bacterium J06641_5]